MVRRDQQARAEEKRVQAEIERALSGEVGGYLPPPRGECREKSWYQAVDDADTIRIRFRSWRKGAVLADFAISVDILDIDAWVTVARVDCTGGTCHLHPPDDLDSHVVLVSLNDAGDLRSAFEVASGRLHEIAIMMRDKGRNDDDE
jgi:hypothetical protein